MLMCYINFLLFEPFRDRVLEEKTSLEFSPTLFVEISFKTWVTL